MNDKTSGSKIPKRFEEYSDLDKYRLWRLLSYNFIACLEDFIVYDEKDLNNVRDLYKIFAHSSIVIDFKKIDHV